MTDGDGAAGVLLLHGFTGVPGSVEPWAAHLREHGHHVETPTLPGHGTTWRDLNTRLWPEWYATVDAAVTALLAQHDRVVVGGLSLGGTLTLRLAEVRGQDLAGVMLVNPFIQIDDKRLVALPLLKRVLGALPGVGDDIAKPGVTEHAYDRLPLKALAQVKELLDLTRKNLDEVRTPVLMMRSTVDHAIGTPGQTTVLDGIASTDVTDVVLEHSYHVATLDHDAELIASSSAAFVERVTAGATGTADAGGTADRV